MRRQYTAEQRREFIDLVTAGRATISEAAARLGVPPSTAYYWARKAATQPRPARTTTRALIPAKPATASPPAFVQLIRARDTGAVIEVRIGATAIQDVLKIASRDLPDPARITSHRLRHTFATELLSAGMSLVGVMRLLGHRDHRMTLRYAAVTPEIVAEEYQKALDKLATKYRLPPTPAAAPPAPEGAPDPDQLLDHLARWVRKHAAPPGAPRDLLRRIERLRRDVQTQTLPTKK